jgi:hypothetical protein
VSAHSVKLSLEDGSAIYITASKARALRKDGKVSIVSTKPFELRLRVDCRDIDPAGMQRWSTHSDGMKMNGAVLMKMAPRP